MKRLIFAPVIVAALMIAACAGPVIKEDLLESGIRNVPMTELAAHPERYRGKLFILGGIIANTTVTDKGTVIEALYVPVDKKGYFEKAPGLGRYKAFWPKSSGILDPMTYSRNRRITVAGTFEGIRRGKLDKTIYAFPYFDAVQIFLWKETPAYPSYYYGPSYYGPYYSYPYYYPYPNYPYGYGFEFEQGPEEQEELERNEFREPEERPEFEEHEFERQEAPEGPRR